MRNPMRTRNFMIAAAGVAGVFALALGQAMLDDGSPAQAQGRQAPIFETDPFWPKPLPNHWLLGSAIGVDVDAQDHVWIVHRGDSLGGNETPASLDPPLAAECCAAAPPVLEFDSDGNLVGHWGGPGEGYTWPSSNHGITVDHMDNLWIGGNGGVDSHVLKFTRDGQFLLEVGEPGMNPDSNSQSHYSRVAKVSIDAGANEAYFADGYGNRRVAVVDMTTGQLKRYWGAYGNPPEDGDNGRYDPSAPPSQQFRNPVHCAEVSNSGLIYVCDRQGDRIQVFQKDGTFVDEVLIAASTLGAGSVWDLDFSKDDNQTYMYVADGMNQKVYIVERESLELLTSFGDGGRQAGAFYGVHSIATDSEGNIYTTETYEGKRLQKFVYKGTGPVRAMNQGVVWPSQ